MQSSVSFGRPVNGRSAKLTHIGYVHTTEPFEYRVSYETASWYTLVDVPAGTYEVILSEDGIKWVLVRYIGTVTKEHFVNRLFQHSSVREPTENIGKQRSCTAQMYPYDAAKSFATDSRWELAEDWSTTSEERQYSDGRPYTAYSLVAPEGQKVAL
jgi:hypothetical protein